VIKYKENGMEIKIVMELFIIKTEIFTKGQSTKDPERGLENIFIVLEMYIKGTGQIIKKAGLDK
jgi:hypothetical protein